MIGKKQIEIKLDGVRVLTIIRQNKVEMFSRNGKQFHNFGHIINLFFTSIKTFASLACKPSNICINKVSFLSC